jgi:hypothetical protein
LDSSPPPLEGGGVVVVSRLTLHQQQRQHLDRLAQTHVVGQAGAEAQAGQQMQPLQAGALVRPQRAAQRRAGIDAGTLRRAQAAQRLRQPRPRGDRGPLGGGSFPRRILGNPGAGEQAHRLGEAQPVLRRQRLGVAELGQRLFEPFAVELDPAAAQQRQAVGAGEQGADLRLGERLAVQRDGDREIQQSGEPQLGRRVAADGRRHARARRAAGVPAGRHAQDDAGGFQIGGGAEQAGGVGGTPAQRVVDPAALDQLAQPGAALGGALHRQQQRQQLVAVAGVGPQGLAQRQVLRAGLGGKLRGVGGHEGERRVRVAAVLGQVEVDAPDQVPGRVQRLEEVLQAAAGGLERPRRRFGQRGPERAQHVGRQILGPRHHRCRQHQRGQVGLARRRDAGQGRRRLGRRRVQAERGHVARGEVAPPDEDRRQGLAQLGGPESEQSRPGAGGKFAAQAGRRRRVHGGGIVGVFRHEMSLRRQAQAEGAGMLGGGFGWHADGPIQGGEGGVLSRDAAITKRLGWPGGRRAGSCFRQGPCAISRPIDRATCKGSGTHGAILSPPVAAYEIVRVTRRVQAEGYRIPKDTPGTVVAVFDRGVACAVAIADLPGGPEVVTLREDQIERMHRGIGRE